MTKVLIAAIIMAGLGFVTWSMFPEPEQSAEIMQEMETIKTTEADVDIVREPSADDRLVYINQEWRFSFEYPNDWSSRIPAFGSKVSMFNMELYPSGVVNFPDPVSINITPKWWIERLLPEIEAQDNQPATTVIDGKTAIVGSFISHSVIEAKQYFMLINDEYWIDLSGKIQAGEVPGYAEELEIVRSSFRFHEPLPTLEDLDIEPYQPEN